MIGRLPLSTEALVALHP